MSGFMRDPQMPGVQADSSSLGPVYRQEIRVGARYDELMEIGKHGHYETMFQVVREECERITKPLEPLDRWYGQDHEDKILLSRTEVGYLLGIHVRPAPASGTSTGGTG